MANIPESFASTVNADGTVTLPVHQEKLNVGIKTVDTGRGVRISKSVTQQPQRLEQTLLHDEVEVTHVPIDEIVALDAAPSVRYEGDTLVLPVVEEILVVEKRLRIKEEIRITRIKRETRHVETHTLKSEQVCVERFDETAATQEK
jgi:uncharacterized protein (TIGR02271 family)